MGNVGVGLFRGGKAACVSEISASRGQISEGSDYPRASLNNYVSPLDFTQQQAEHGMILLFDDAL